MRTLLATAALVAATALPATAAVCVHADGTQLGDRSPHFDVTVCAGP